MRRIHSIFPPLLLLAFSLIACTLAGSGQTVPPPSPTPDLPTVRFLYPENNAQVYEGTDLTLDLLAEDGVGVRRVELFVDSLSDAEPFNSATPPAIMPEKRFRVEMNWLAAGVGRHQITAKAYRADNTPGDETTIVVEVIPRPTP